MMTRKRKAADDGKTGDEKGGDERNTDDDGSLTLEEVKGKLDGDSCYIVASYMEHKWDDGRNVSWHHPTSDMLVFLRRIRYDCGKNRYDMIVSNVAHECNLDRLKLALALSQKDDEAIGVFDSVCSDGHLPSVQYMVERYEISREDIEINDSRALWWACSDGRLSVVQYLVTHFGLSRDRHGQSAFYACQNGHLDVVKYLVETFRLTADDVSLPTECGFGGEAFSASCSSVTYAHSQFHLSGGPHNQEPTWKRSDQFGVLQYLSKTFTIPKERVDERVWVLMCRDGLLDRIRHLVDYFKIPYDPMPHWLPDGIHLSTREKQHTTVAFLISHFRLSKRLFESFNPFLYDFPEPRLTF